MPNEQLKKERVHLMKLISGGILKPYEAGNSLFF